MRSAKILFWLTAILPAALAAAQNAHPDGGMGLPAGHPTIPGMSPTTQPAASGTITIHAIQATKGAAPLGQQTVKVQLVHRGRIFRELETKLDDKGTATIANLPLVMPFQAQAIINHAGVDYAGVSDWIYADQPAGEIELKVYETTEAAPAWNIAMRHVAMDWQNGMLVVREMVAIESPSDRTWIGQAQPDGKRTTVKLPLPAGVDKVEAGGDLEQSAVAVKDGSLVSSMPLEPGVTKMRYAYVVPMTARKASLSVVAPVPVRHMMLFAPDDGTTVRATGLESLGTQSMGEGRMQMFQGSELGAGFRIDVNVTAPAPVASAHTPASTTRIIVIVGAVVVLLIGAGIFLFKKSPTAGKPAEAK